MKQAFNKLLLAFLLLLTAGHAYSQTNYPVPPAKKNMLFYLQRTHNTNTLIYEMNYKDGKLDEEEPVKVYWIRYEEGGKIEPLSTIQRNFAYGVSATMYNKEKKWFKVTLQAYDKVDIYVKNSAADKKYHAYIKINGALAELTSIFIKTNGGSFWSPNVVHIEVKGKDVQTGKAVSEKIKPVQ